MFQELLQPDRQDQQHHADDPVEFTRWFVAAGEEDAEHVQPNRDDHGVGTPAMDLAEQAERDRRPQGLHVGVGVFGDGAIVEHQRDASDEFDEEQMETQPPDPPGERGAEDVATDGCRVNVQEEIAQDGQDARTTIPRDAVANDGLPGLRVSQSFLDAFKHEHPVVVMAVLSSGPSSFLVLPESPWVSVTCHIFRPNGAMVLSPGCKPWG